MATLTEAQRAELDALRRSYQAELPEKLELIAGAVEALQTGGWDKADLHALYLLIHKLAGSAAIYGFDGISRTAGEIETWILAAPPGGVPEPRRGELLPLVSALQSAFAATVTAAVKPRASPASG
jgi:chemotaxis protein histidine kinase CheA